MTFGWECASFSWYTCAWTFFYPFLFAFEDLFSTIFWAPRVLVFIFKPIFPLNSWIFLKVLSFASFLVVLPKLLRYIRQILFYPMLLIKTIFFRHFREYLCKCRWNICVCADLHLCACRWNYFREYLCVFADEATASWNFSHKAIKPSQPASLIISTIIFWNRFRFQIIFKKIEPQINWYKIACPATPPDRHTIVMF